MSEAKIWKSPVTGQPLSEVTLEGMTVHFDPASGGYWLERGELKNLAEHHHAHLEDVPFGQPLRAHKGYACPKDGRELVEFEFGQHSGIKVDVCGECGGLWLDSGELDKILAYLETHEFGKAVAPAQRQEPHLKLTDRVLLFLYKLTEHPPLM